MEWPSPGQKPDDVVEIEAFTVVNEEGESETWSWEEGSPDQVYEDVVITMVNTRSKYKGFNIYPPDSDVEVFGGHSRFSHFHWWNHWPVSQITSDGRGARAADRAAHSSLVWGVPSEPFLMYGLTNKPANELMTLAGSWNDPPKIQKIKGAKSSGYDQKQRAYLIEGQKETIGFVLRGAVSSPIFNPCFIIKNWNSGKVANIVINSNPEGTDDDIKQGIIRDTDGTRTLVVWLRLQSTEEVNVVISE